VIVHSSTRRINVWVSSLHYLTKEVIKLSSFVKYLSHNTS